MSERRAAASSTYAPAQQAADDTLRAGGSALKAALTGFFAAAGSDPGVLCSPVGLLVVGLGSGARAYDGRCRQPGVGGKRPRGFLSADDVPRAAHAAVPASIAALAVAAAYGGVSLSACVRPSLSVAKRADAAGRAGLLGRIAELGAKALSDAAVKRTWLAEFGPVEGGMVTPQDLASSMEIDAPARARDDGFFVVPWSSESSADAGAREALGEGHALIAADAQGQLVALSFRSLPSTLTLLRYQVHVPALAEPVMRNVSRLAPGAPLPSPADLAILAGEGRGEDTIRATVDSGATLALSRDPLTKTVHRTAI